MAATSRKWAGRVTRVSARAMRIRPSSNGWRSESRTIGANSPSSSRNSTPPWLSEISPGRSRPEPPPIMATALVPWWGARSGGRRTSPPGRGMPAAECTRVASRAWASSRSGRRPGRRWASIVLPAPGGPTIRRWWPPAAATSSAARARGWPRTSARSGAALAGGSTGGSGATGHGASAFSASTSRVRSGAHSTRWRPTSSASKTEAGGTTTSAASRASTRDSAPGTWRRRAVEAELTDEGPLPHGLGRELLAGHQHADGDGQVEGRADLAHRRGGEVDRGAGVGPLEAAREQGGPHTVAGLAARRVGEAHDGEAGKAPGDVDLDGDRDAVDPDEGGGRDGGEHGLRPPAGTAPVGAGSGGRLEPPMGMRLRSGCDSRQGSAIEG